MEYEPSWRLVINVVLDMIGIRRRKALRRGDFRFFDIESGEPVYYYHDDESGKTYLATSARARYRLEVTHADAIRDRLETKKKLEHEW